MNSATDNVCPRCGGMVPNNLQPGAYPGAGSRVTTDRSIEICSRCGVDEAVGRGTVPPEYWPILTRSSIPNNANVSLPGDE